ncbi:microtubule-associated protein futsch [Wyeomyia smithii]|uniref:microtubule-associated protein futsch n=1 Tax=Wyeomyia smithii TaxID=174621 RepID=UPI002467B8DD|nr:microtubule-associated protein futsch [Wyeomyia smithii]
MSGDQSGPLELNGTGGGVTPGGDGGSNGALADGTMNGGTASPGGGGGSEAGGTGGLGAGDAGCSDGGPPSIVGVGPPSPLTGCYLLIVIGEPHSQDHKDIILQRLIKGFLSWDVSDCHVDLEEELNTITLQALEGEEGKHGERLIQYASENLVTEILIHPQINTFIQCIRNLLSSFTRHRHIIHTGYTFAANGSWVLQDGTFSVVDFMEAFQEHEVQRVLRAYPDTITMDVHCAPVGTWTTIQDKSFARLCRIRLNPVDVLSSGSDKLSAFVDYLAAMIVPTEISELLESSDVVGNIRFSHPTLYVFPGGQGDAALFGINGFNMLVDGGFSRKSCFWDFVRHLDRLDAVLMTRINNTNIKGISAVVERKNEAHVYPQIGHFFCNIPERKSLLSPDGDKDRDPLLVDLIEEGHKIVTNLKSLNLKAQNCYRDAEPINLYHKVGHGTLDMYVISPAKDSKEVKEFLAKWHAADPKLFTPKDSKEFTFPIQNIISICALLVWTPANPEDNITRILFPGSAPEYKILEGLEKMKNVEFMRHPLCTVKSIAPSLSTQTISKKSLKSSSIDKIIPEPILPSKVLKPSEKDNKLMDNKMKMIDNKLADAAKSSSEIMDSSGDEAKLEKHVTKSSMATFAAAKVDAGKLKSAKVKSTESAKKQDNKLIESSKKIDFDEKKDSTSDGGSDKDDTEKKPEEEREKKEDETVDAKKEESPSAKDESKTVKKVGERVSRPATARSRIDTKPPTKVTKTIKKKDETNKSSPTTPKKAVEPKLTNGVAEKKEDAESKKAIGPPKTTKPVATRPGKTSPRSTPAKSAKDANNRKVLEARQRPITKPPVKKEPVAAPEKKDSPPKIERKPISRRPKAAAPGHAVGGSPVKAKKVLKSEKDAVIRKAKLDKNGTTDSSLVSTPSADEAGVAVQKRIVDPVASTNGSVEGTTVDPQHLAELKEEQDAVREIEAVFKRDSEKAKRHELLSEHREIQDSATEPEEEEEYLIIEKEEQYTEDSINEPESSATKEEEIQKHQRDSEESEKRKRDSLHEEKTDLTKAEGETATVIEIVEGDKEEAAEEEEEEPKPEEKEAIIEKEAMEKVKEETEEEEKLSPKHKQDLEEEVQDIIASAKEIAKSKMETSMDGLKTEEISSFSPDEKISSTKKTSDTRDENEPEPAPKEQIGAPQESHHEERVSATGESGATTTAPTLPEDERIPLDEIKEDLVIEEKHVKEETKEVEVAPPLPTVYEPLERPTPAKMHFSAQQAHIRDVVKTPDEVADLPVHEEADFEEYSEDKDKEAEKERHTKDKAPATEAPQKKQTEAKQPEKTDKVVADKSAESDKQCDTVKDVQEEVLEVVEKMRVDTKLDRPPKLETQSSPAKDKVDEAAVLQDIESQIISKDVEVKEKVEPSVAKDVGKTPEPVEAEADDEEDKKSVHEDVIVPTKVEPKVPVSAESSVLDEIWQSSAKAEQKLEELKNIIEDKAKETTSDLGAMKDEMFQELVDRKEQIVETVTADIKDSVAELGKEADEVVKTIGEELQSKAQQADEKLAAGVEQTAAKAEEILETIAAEKKELEQLAKEIKEEVAGKLEETKKQIDIEVNKTVEQLQEQAKTGISSFSGGITDGIKSGIEKMADKVETEIKEKTEQVEDKLQAVSDKIDELKGKEAVEKVCQKKEDAKVPEAGAAFDASFGRSFTQELRETHITTLDSPIGDADKTLEMKAAIKIPQHIDEDKELEEIEDAKQAAAGSFVIEEVKYSNFEDANLRDIKEEEEEDRVSPPQKDDKKPVSPRLEPLKQPPRSRTPEDVAKIVANVAEVLKSDKDLEEIIPGFDPQELERKLSQGAAREEDVSTVQRMLVTTSSEDGGEEIDICPAGTITFSKSATPEPVISGKTTPEIRVDEEVGEAEKKTEEKVDEPQLPEVKAAEKTSPTSSGKSSPDLKTSPTSIEEKEKHELPEKVVADVKKTPEKVADERKESLTEQFDRIDDSRRESAISTFSERDYTKDESSFVDERDSSRAHSISSHISELNEDETETKAADTKADTVAQPEKAKVDSKKVDELSSPESITSQKTVSEKSVPEKEIKAEPPVKEEKTETKKPSRPESASSEKPASDKPAEASRPESVASHTSEKAPSDKLSAAEPSRPESAASHASDKAPSDGKQESKEISRPESAVSQAGSDKPEEKTKDASRPESAASHVSEKASAETKEASRPESAASHVSEKPPSDKPEAKEASRPESVVSHVSEKAPSVKSDEKETSRPESVASHVSSEKAPSEKPEAKDSSRPESVASHVSSEKAPSEKPEAKEASRPESVASHVSEKSPSEKADVKAEDKEASRPESVASHVSDKEAEKPASLAESAASHVSESVPAEDKAASRPPASAASHVSEKSEPKLDSKEKPNTATVSKESSRPASAASHVSEKAPSEKSEDKSPLKEASHPESAASEKPDDKTVVKGVSRPESAASQVSEKAATEKSDDKQETSRPESATSLGEKRESLASQSSSKPDADEKLSEPAKDASRPTSAASEKSMDLDGKQTSPKDEKKETDRPESVASQLSDSKSPAAHADDKLGSRPESAASHISEKPDDKELSKQDVKETSRPESTASHVSDKEQPKDSSTPAAEAKTSRPESAASHVSDSGKKDEKASSRPESAASHVSDKSSKGKQAEEKKSDADKDRPASTAASEKDASRPTSAASHVSEKLEAPKDASRPLSAASVESEKSPVAPAPDKAPSRPESVASHVSGKDEEEASRPVSVASHASEKIPSAEAEPAQAIVNGDYSRPESPASCSSDKVIPSKEPESKIAEKDLARQDSTASYHGEPIPDEKSFSRPDSPASCGEDQKENKEPVKPTTEKDTAQVQEEKPKQEGEDFSRPESPASCGDGSEQPTPSAPESTVPEKNLARQDSSASYHGEAIPGEKTFSRPESPASCAEDDAKPTSRPESVVSEKAASDKSTGKEASRPESAASHQSEKDKSPITTETDASKSPAGDDKPKQDSRPGSAASHVSDKSQPAEAKDSQSRRASADRPTSALSDHADEAEDKIVLKESRSKSLSAVMSSTPQRSGFDGGALGVLEEATSRDDLHVLKTPRDSITKIVELKQPKSESKLDKPLFGAEHFPVEEKTVAQGFPTTGTEKESPDHSARIAPGLDQLLKDTCSSMKEIDNMSTSVISMIKTSEKKEETSKADDKGLAISFPILDSGKSTPVSVDKDKSQASSIKSASPHEKDSLEESSVSLNTFIEKDSLSESTTKQVTIKTSTIDESALKATTSAGGKVESSELLGGSKTPPTAPISPSVVKEDFGLGQQIESTVTSSTPTTTTTTTASGQVTKSHKEDASGVSTPKESVPSGKSSPGLMSVHTGSTDSASKSINLGHSSGIETSDSSPKPTSPFPKVVDTLKTDDIKTSSGMSTPDMTRTSTPDMVDSQIERIPDDKSTVTTTTTKTTRYIVEDGEKIEVGSSVKTETFSDAKKDDTSSAGESLSTSSVTTTTATKIVKEPVKTPGALTLTSTEGRSLTDEFDDKDALSPRSDISSGQASRIVAGWHDEEVPGSPMSVTSQAPLSPSTKYTYDYDFQHSSSGVSKKSDIEIDDSQDEIPPQYDSEEVKSAITIASAYKPDPMSTSFYGQLPDVSDTTATTTSATTKSVPIPITAGKAGTKAYMEYASSGDSSSVDSSLQKPMRDSKYLDDADLDFEKTFTKSDQVDLMTTSMHFSSETEFLAATNVVAPSAPTTIADSSKKELDFTASGLPSTGTTQAQTTVTTTAQPSTTTTTSSTDQSQPDKNKDILASWGKPLGLPSPAPLNDADMKTTPKKERRMIISKTRLNNEKNLRKRSESPIKPAKKPAPVYVDLSYVPHHGNSYYANVEFFKRVRARYYVFSGTEPSREVYNALLEAKQTWEDKELEVTIIPTYDTDVLGYWVSENEDLLAKYHIDLSPSAARCTINLQDHETSCSAYRLEF